MLLKTGAGSTPTAALSLVAKKKYALRPPGEYSNDEEENIKSIRKI